MTKAQCFAASRRWWSFVKIARLKALQIPFFTNSRHGAEVLIGS